MTFGDPGFRDKRFPIKGKRISKSNWQKEGSSIPRSKSMDGSIRALSLSCFLIGESSSAKPAKSARAEMTKPRAFCAHNAGKKRGVSVVWLLMKRILASQLAQCIGQKVFLRGWLNNLRSFGKLHFLILRDRSGLGQVVVTDSEQGKILAQLHPGSILKITGTALASA